MTIMNKLDRFSFQIEAYSSCTDNAELSLIETKKRVHAIYAYLIYQGFEPTKLIPIGYGQQYPASPCNCHGSHPQSEDCTKNDQ